MIKKTAKGSGKSSFLPVLLEVFASVIFILVFQRGTLSAIMRSKGKKPFHTCENSVMMFQGEHRGSQEDNKHTFHQHSQNAVTTVKVQHDSFRSAVGNSAGETVNAYEFEMLTDHNIPGLLHLRHKIGSSSAVESSNNVFVTEHHYTFSGCNDIIAIL
jgi:hypothetical protein